MSIAEVFGFIALVTNFIAYRQPTADRYRIVSALALAALSIHFFMLDAVAGGIVTGIAVLRNFIALRWQGPWVLWGFVALNILFLMIEWLFPIASLQFSFSGISVVFSDQPSHWSIWIAYTSSIIFTVGSIKLNDPERIRRWFLLAEFLGLVYAIIVGSISGTVFNIVNLTSIILKLLQDKRARTL
ncbi:YgjV family protein [Pseudidiomarina sp. 1APP75-32.1]|uniref:YgjV family protein n=1 Tax=Pseudidiomarina terrestris TaxID=2820060 RepID=A0AAW7QYF3_9GAMM|nr:YgjV family protein [Pseudidiomarina sp. 1APP75-32.1]MDN7126419.1 YgjV family protein [Pseudidiomarina sp. 1APR75-33.1]MDN7128509.1 YgjV family protein [Pseudidiomarina sp. 1APR75-15]MDN7135243.1 YgjV family protein [Pseudidiomarina sp. 1ASP75-5]MDN7137916.1 YgjV family protein [Pseudidiomarina sp. 1ASP75-14]MEA3586987.1 YgjV family protein [Pseudidiomarina sp. 1APP75-27a]